MALVHKIPVGLTIMRAALGPVVLATALLSPNRAVFAACLVAAFLSDILDGMVARRLGVATEGIRRLDSIADSVFYICVCVAAYLLYPEAILERATALGLLIFLEVLRYAVDYAKYRREASYHMWSSKAWGVFLFVGFLSLLSFGHAGLLLSLAVYIGIVADAEGLLISFLLKEWRHDVPTFVHALRIRNAAAQH